ncbi:MAG: SDR family oxidoreductase [Deltaproteobacteria bacterium]|nr:SDR family oxidoreductase [Deltaproteobacteria bacterium]
MGRFKDKVVWITGAGTGIGRATARMFASEGATLALIGRRAEVLEGVLDEVASKGGSGLPVPLDISDRAAVTRAAQMLLTRWGRVDILVNNAGMNVPKRRLTDLSGADWDQVVAVNLTGAFNMIQVVLPPMRAQGGGLIVNVSSQAGVAVSGLSGSAYTASKHGFNGLSHSINQEEWRHGIRSTALCPGEVNTELIDKRPIPVSPADRARMIHPDDMADAVRFVSCMDPRTTITEMQILPTHKRSLNPGETG